MNFDKRTAKVVSVDTFDFKPKNSKKMYGWAVEVDNGDNFKIYHLDSKAYEKLTKGIEITYSLEKVDGKTKAKIYMNNNEGKALISQLDSIPLESLLFIDIETIREKDKITKSKDEDLFNAWVYKNRRLEESGNANFIKKLYETDSPLYPEFGKIACISIGMIKNGVPVIKSYYSESEEEVLTDFVKALGAFKRKYPRLMLAGYSIVGFDIPYILKRMLKNGIRVPAFLNIIQEKPWTLDSKFIDLNLWLKTTSFYNASLSDTAFMMGVKTPKDSIDGSMVSDTYYREKDGLQKVVEYCEKDVLCCINIMQRLYNLEISESYESKTNFTKDSVQQEVNA